MNCYNFSEVSQGSILEEKFTENLPPYMARRISVKPKVYQLSVLKNNIKGSVSSSILLIETVYANGKLLGIFQESLALLAIYISPLRGYFSKKLKYYQKEVFIE